MVEEIQLLLDLFYDFVPDKETNRLVYYFCNKNHDWHKAHDLFHVIRIRNNNTSLLNDKAKTLQYGFEEVVVKTLYNLIHPQAPFDPDSPYYIIKCAFQLADELNISKQDVIDIIK